MSAEVETMAWSGAAPWHGQGVRVQADITCADMLKLAGLDWTVSKRKLFTANTSPEDGAFTSDPVEVPGRFALVRDSDEKTLDIVGKRYVPVQNADSMGFFADFVRSGGMELHTAGSLCGGQYVWVLAKIKQQLKIMRNDELESYLLLMSPHKLGLPLVAQHTAVRVVCWNTLNAALGSSLKGSGKHTFRMPHVHKFDAAMQEKAKQALGYATEQFKQFGEAAALLAKTSITAEARTDYFKRVFKLDPESLKLRGREDEADKAFRVIKQLEEAALASPGANLKSAEGTLWGAFNAVTFQVDHVAGRDRDKTLRDIWLGYRGETKRRALSEALALAA